MAWATWGAFGAGEYSMRVWLDPEKMRMRNLTPEDVMGVIESQNMQVSAGAVGTAPFASPEAFQFTLTARGRLTSADEFGNIILRSTTDGEILRLRDVAHIDLGSASYSNTPPTCRAIRPDSSASISSPALTPLRWPTG